MDTVHAWVVPSQHRSRDGARQLLADAVAHVLGTDPSQVVVSRSGSGQPTVQAAGGPVWVSLSYGPGVLAAAVSLVGPVGIDIEGSHIEGSHIEGSHIEGTAEAEVVRLADRWFDPAEATWLRSRPAAEQPTAFLLLWTAKEALGKALGTGLRGTGLQRRVPLPPCTDGSFRDLPDGLWLAHPPLHAPLVLAVATGGPVSGIELHESGDHVALARSTARSRTSLPVVVRGN
jgi:4'-phosphopantetheinyl transferase